MEFGRYLNARILGWRSRRPVATPPPHGMGYIRRTRVVECQSCSNHSHSMHLGPLVWAPRSLIARVALRTLVARVALRSLVTTVRLMSRSVNSTRRKTYEQLAACSSSPYSDWFAPLSIPPGSPAALAPVSEPLGGTTPRESRKPRRMRR